MIRITRTIASIGNFLRVLTRYREALKLQFSTPESLRTHQKARLVEHLAWVAKNSPFYAPYAGLPLEQWPIIDKATWIGRFDEINTAGLELSQVQSIALKAEQTRDFAPTLGDYTVGLSSGTSGSRGVFVASSLERAQWAGLALARLLPNRLFAGERVAFFLRANSNLYTTVASPWLTFRFFDLLATFDEQLPQLQAYRPTVIIAPAQVLGQLAIAQRDGKLTLPRTRTISVAEVLEPSDRALLEQTFGPPEQVYQATEGFLAYTCPHGSLHLNEEFLHVEPCWVDVERTRMMPIITDFTRRTQPLIRYKLNDVLAVSHSRCSCGNPSTVLSHIEGRNDDMLILPGRTGPVPVFADALSRLLLQVLPMDKDYRLTQTSETSMTLQCVLEPEDGDAVLAYLKSSLPSLGVDSRRIRLELDHREIPFDPSVKRRRIRKLTA